MQSNQFISKNIVLKLIISYYDYSRKQRMIHFFGIISLENVHLRFMYLGLTFAQAKWSFAGQFNGTKSQFLRRC